MEQVVQIAVLCVLGAVLALLLKKATPEIALLLTLGVGVIALLSLLSGVGELLAFLKELMEKTAVSQAVFQPLLKTVGIALVARVGGDLCRDAGESALASTVETAGAFCGALVSLPLLRAVFAMLSDLL
ncbi:MAG: SpoIIIAC/SpoIIIAD family protein [Oscillospiraceae bacterium]